MPVRSPLISPPCVSISFPHTNPPSLSRDIILHSSTPREACRCTRLHQLSRQRRLHLDPLHLPDSRCPLLPPRAGNLHRAADPCSCVCPRAAGVVGATKQAVGEDGRRRGRVDGQGSQEVGVYGKGGRDQCRGGKEATERFPVCDLKGYQEEIEGGSERKPERKGYYVFVGQSVVEVGANSLDMFPHM